MCREVDCQAGCGLVAHGLQMRASALTRLLCFGSGRCSGRQVAIDVAEALAYLHDQNVLHGDICAR